MNSILSSVTGMELGTEDVSDATSLSSDDSDDELDDDDIINGEENVAVGAIGGVVGNSWTRERAVSYGSSRSSCANELIGTLSNADDAQSCENTQEPPKFSSENKEAVVKTNTHLNRSESSKKKYCENCMLHKSCCLHGKYVLKVNEKTVGMKVKTCGSFWSSDMIGKIGLVVGGDFENAKITWNQHLKDAEVWTFFLKSHGTNNFKFWCREENAPIKASKKADKEVQAIQEESKTASLKLPLKNKAQRKPSAEPESSTIANDKVSIKTRNESGNEQKTCPNCNLQGSACLHRRFLKNVGRITVDQCMKVKACGSSWPADQLGRVGQVAGGGATSVNIRWNWASTSGDKWRKLDTYSLLVGGEQVRAANKLSRKFLQRIPLLYYVRVHYKALLISFSI